MPLTTNYDLVSFDAAQAIMYLRVRVLDGATVIETNEDVPVRIPVDVSGTVPVGAALTGVLDRAIARTFSETTLAEKERLYNIESNGGLVINRAAIIIHRLAFHTVTAWLKIFPNVGTVFWTGCIVEWKSRSGIPCGAT
jgi:hypothetical protein